MNVVERQHCNCYLQRSIKAFKRILKAPMTYFYSRNCLHEKGFKTLIFPFRQTSADDDSLKAFFLWIVMLSDGGFVRIRNCDSSNVKRLLCSHESKRETPEMENPKGNAKYIKMSSSVQKANGWKEFKFLLESNSLWVFWYSFSDSFLCSIALCVSINANRWPRSVKYFVYIPAKLMATYSSVLATICLTTHDESMHGSSSFVFWNLVNVVMMMWVIAVMVPPIMHHLSGSGSIAYGTKRVNRMYQTRYSRSAKPIPSPTKPA